MDNLEQIIQRYVLGQLDEQEAEVFEAYFLSRPDVAGQIDAVQQLHIGLTHLDAECQVDAKTQHTAAPSWAGNQPRAADRSVARFSMSQVISRYLVGPAQSMVMAGLLVVLAPMALNSMQSSNQGVTAQLVRLDSATVRSQQASSQVVLPANGEYAAVMVRVRDVEFPNYRLQLSGGSNWVSEPFQFSNGTRDHLVLVPPRASTERVEITLLGIAPNGEKRTVEFCSYTEACL